jgi:aspartyl-tRNA(Asn)/glutamyl-tRNA(Gln) amidotransferase subunit A
MDQVGPIACSIDDTNALFSLIGGNDELDSTSLPNRGHNEVSSTSTAVRLGIPNEYLTEACQPAVVETVWRIADLAVELGWKVSTVNVPLTAYALSIYYIIASVEAASNLARFAGTIYGYHTPDAINWNELAVRTRTSGFGAEVKRRIMLGTYTASAGYADQFYNKACRARSALSAEYERTFEKVDLILSPVSPTTAWCLGERINDPMRMYLSDIYSVPASLAGIPAVVIPSGHDEDGLPIGLQLSARARSDNYLLRQAKHLETQLARAAAHS